MKKLTAGDGYLYLTQQVASGDGRRNGQDLVDYYSAHGMPEGTWWGKGAAALGVEGVVTEAQMAAAFGEFLHPNADTIIPTMLKEGSRLSQAEDAVRLGRRAPDFNKDITFLTEVATRKQAFLQAHHRLPNQEEREYIETLTAKDLMPSGQHDPAQVRFFIAEQKRKARHAVAGYDLVFTPMKSVSVLWGIGDDATRKAIMKAHHQAVDAALTWIEDNALYTRAGAQGIKKLDCDGMIATRFVHWDNRAGDPNLHTHCAILNRVPSQGTHRTIDGTILYRSAVTASELYNNQLKELIEKALPVSFSPVEKRGKRPVWEIDGVPAKLMDAMSRRSDVLARQRELIEDYRKTYGREPSKAVQIQLAEQANLDTRGAKKEPKSLQEMVNGWRKQANETSKDFTTASILNEVFSPKNTDRAPQVYNDFYDDELSSQVLKAVEKDSSTWTSMRVESEIYRQLNAYTFTSLEQKQHAVARILDLTLVGKSICIDQRPPAPAGLCRKDGESIFVAHGSTRYTSNAIIKAENRLIQAAQQWCVNTSTEAQLSQVQATLARKNGYELSAEQANFVRHLLFNPARVAVGIGAAGTGKTTAMEAFARAVEADGRKVFSLAPSAKAAEVLGDSLGVEARTLASLLVKIDDDVASEHQGSSSDHGGHTAVDAELAGSVFLIDEAGMASTHDLDRVVEYANRIGAFVRMVGDPDQLSSVETGGILEEIATLTDAPVLREVRRFKDPSEAECTLKLRDGNTEALNWYFDHDRVVTGLREELPGMVFDDWCASRAQGRNAIMIAADNLTVDALNEMARNYFIDAGIVAPDKGEGAVEISGHRHAGIGDVIVTRMNNGMIRFGHNSKYRVKNGDLWTVEKTHKDGALTVVHHGTGSTVQLPGKYVKENVELGYASTVHRCQGMTVDEAFFLPSPKMDRQGLYVAMTRGKTLNRVYVADDEIPDRDDHSPQQQPPLPREILETIMDRDGRSVTARATLEHADAPTDMSTLSLMYTELNDQLICENVVHHAKEAGLEEAAELLRSDWQTPRLGALMADLDVPEEATSEVLSDAISRAWQRYTAHEDATKENSWVVARHSENQENTDTSLAFLVRMELSNALGDRPAPELTGKDLWSVTDLTAPTALHECMDADVHQAMRNVAQQIYDRLGKAADSAVNDHPDWVKSIGPYDPENEDYHEKWLEAVRVIAAGREMENADALTIGHGDVSAPSPYSVLHEGLERAHREKTAARYESMGYSELERFRDHCTTRATDVGSQAHIWELRAATITQMRPHMEEALAERTECLRQAEQAAPIIQARQQAQHLNDELIRARSLLAAAHKENIFSRGKKIKQAQERLDAVSAHQKKASELYRHLVASSSLSAEQADKAAALSKNDGQWSRRFEQAHAKDQELINQAARKARSLRTDERLWRQRSERVADKLKESRPLTHEEAQVYIQKIKEKLNRKPPAGATTSLSGSNPYSLDAGDELAADLKAQRTRKQTHGTPTQDAVSTRTQRHHTHKKMEL